MDVSAHTDANHECVVPKLHPLDFEQFHDDGDKSNVCSRLHSYSTEMLLLPCTEWAVGIK